MPIKPDKLGKKIQFYRLQRKFSQTDLGDLVFVNHEHISRIENGKKSVSLDLLVAIANALEVSADDLLVDSLLYGSQHIPAEVVGIFQNCNSKETLFLLRLLEFTKNLLDETYI